MMSAQGVTWDATGRDAKELKKLLIKFIESNGAEGIDPSITKPKQIRDEVFYKYPFLQKYKVARFPENFRNLARDLDIAQRVTRSPIGKE